MYAGTSTRVRKTDSTALLFKKGNTCTIEDLEPEEDTTGNPRADEIVTAGLIVELR